MAEDKDIKMVKVDGETLTKLQELKDKWQAKSLEQVIKILIVRAEV